MNKQLFFSSSLQIGKTPKDLYDILNKEFNFDFDPCPENPTFNGLLCNWKQSNFINPPYNQQKAWVVKAYLESLNDKICVMLLPARTDTKLFHELIIKKAHEIRFIKGRLQFGGYTNSAPFPSMIVIFKND